MARTLAEMAAALAAWRRDRRRRRNLRAGRAQGRFLVSLAGVRLRLPGDGRPLPVLAVAGVLLALAGAALIAVHARSLASAAAATPLSQAARQAALALQSVAPGAAIDIPSAPGVSYSAHQNGALLVVSGMQAATPVRIDLCSQLRGDGRLFPLRLGNHFSDVERWVGAAHDRGEAIALRNVLLVRDERRMPAVQLGGSASLDAPLRASWGDADASARWISDQATHAVTGDLHSATVPAKAGGTAAPALAAGGQGGNGLLLRHGWLTWSGGALRIERRASGQCPQAGELVVQLYEPSTPPAPTAPPARAVLAALAAPAMALAAPRTQPAPSDARAHVTAFAADGSVSSIRLPAGRYAIPAAAPGALEDEALFKALQVQGLIRLSADGLAEVAPRDLLQWLSAPAEARAGTLTGWRGVRDDAPTGALLKRLYQQADGAYVRQQVDIFNSERRLLAWRLPGVASGAVDIALSADGWPLAASRLMPAAAARLFDEMPEGWQPWTRAASLSAPRVQFTLTLPHPATGRETLTLLLAGRLQSGAAGAQITAASACTGRACSTQSDVQHLALHPFAGARQITFTAAPLDISSAAQPGDQQYRHLRTSGNQLEWHALTRRADTAARAANAGAVRIEDRNGTPLWADGAATQAARDAGMAAMLGLSPEHAASVSGVLARAAAGAPADARMSIDLPLQAKAQQILDCQGLHHGRWDGKTCRGAEAAPNGRRTGFVLLDADTGDILAAAGAGTTQVSADNWQEARDFDRSNPARSPLRLPALQHDGGAHNSPGSTFKIISALGLERAAQTDPQLNALLGGLPLNAINGMADARGFAFRTNAATYPVTPKQAHITNYREQNVERRAQEGRLGLPQALTYSLNTWFAWSGELSDRSLFGRADGGAPDLQALESGALDKTRPILAAARQLGFEQPLRLDGGLLPRDFAWSAYDALQATPSRIDPIHTRHELRQMSIGLRMQATPLQMALASAAIAQGRTVVPRLLLNLNGKQSASAEGQPLGVRLDRIRAGMKGVVDSGTAAGAFSGPALVSLKRGLYGKTGTAPVSDDAATVWFTGWLEPNTLPGRPQRLAFAAFVSHSQGSGGEHAAPIVAAMLCAMAEQNPEQKGK